MPHPPEQSRSGRRQHGTAGRGPERPPAGRRRATPAGAPLTRRELRRRRGPSRRVRLTRTILVASVLVLGIVLVATSPWSGDDQQVTSAPTTASPTTGSPTTASPTTTAPPTTAPATGTTAPGDSASADGSATPDPQDVTVPQNGNGKVTPVAIPGAASTASGRTVTFSVEIEGGLAVDPTEVAGTIRTILMDDRGWQKVDGVKLVAVQPAQLSAGTTPNIRVTLASPGLTDQLCAPLRTLSQVSCWNGSRAVLNLRRWVQGDDSYGTDVALYRVYQVNHEFGHGLGHGHEGCPGSGKRAPVMMQQTLTLGACKPWPYPSGA